MLSWVKFVCLAFCRPRSSVVVPPTGFLQHNCYQIVIYLGTIANPIWFANLCCSVAAREHWPICRPSEFGTTLRIDNSEDAWFREARRPCNQNVVERGHLPYVDHRGPPGHHCLQPPHVVEDSTAFTSSTWRGSIFANICWCCAWTFGCCAWRACKWHTAVGIWWLHLVLRHPSFPSFWPGTASFTLLPFDATGKSSPRWTLALAQEAVRGKLSLRPFSLWHSRISVLCFFFCLQDTQLLTKNIDCEQYTHTYSTYSVAHSIITFHHANTRVSRIAHLCVFLIIVIHVSCLTFPCLLPLFSFHWLHRH